MSSRNRSPRYNGSRRQRRSQPPLMENLENRLVLSGLNLVPPPHTVHPIPPAAQPKASPIVIGKSATSPFGGPTADGSSTAVGLSPNQLRAAYGMNQVTFGTGPGQIKGDGLGQTIALVIWGDNQSFQPTSSPNYVGSALQVFDKTFGLPDPPSFQIYTQNGVVGRTNTNLGAGDELALDVEYSHSMAPMANIDLVEASSNSFVDLGQAEFSAAAILDASVVSMSFGASLESAGFGYYEQELDAAYFAPAIAANPNVTFLASTGDSGAAPGAGYPAVSPLVGGVGGTVITVNGTSPNYTYGGETGWTDGGGNFSNTYPQPSYQVADGFDSNGFRTIPDISSNAGTPVAIYDPFDFPATPWVGVEGTSISSPTWAGFIAVADEGRQYLYDEAPLGGPSQTLPALYALGGPANAPANYNTYFHDIVSGNNGFPAGPGYDLVTGIGSPRLENLLPQLAAYGVASTAAITIQPPVSVTQGGFFGMAIEAQTANGALAIGFQGTATVTLTGGPVGGTLGGTTTASFSSGVAFFNDLTLSNVSATPYDLKVVVSSGASILATLTPDSVVVDTASTANVGVYYPLPLDGSLREDVGTADSDGNATDNLYLVYSQTYDLSFGELLVENTTALPNKTIQFISNDEFATTAPSIDANQSGRVFDIVGTKGGTTNLTVLFSGITPQSVVQGLLIGGGLATDDGGLTIPSGTAVGGGLLVDGGLVTLDNVTLSNNEARGNTGATGSSGGSLTSGPGGPGKLGFNSQGGGIYIAAGTLTLHNDAITGNVAQGGAGGRGGTGGNGTAITSFGFFIEVGFLSGGPGGTGGVGGAGAGGALYVAGGSVSITSGTMSGNSAIGGNGGQGGFGGHGGTVAFKGGTGGLGGVGGQGQGGGIYLQRGSINLNSAGVDGNFAAGGNGGDGGTGGSGGYSLANTRILGPGGNGGIGGKGGNGDGGGLFVLSGTLSWLESSLDTNTASAGPGGLAGKIGPGKAGGAVGTAGQGGTGSGGGVFDQGNLTLTGASIVGNKAQNGGGIEIHGTLTLNSSTVNGNSAVDNGGGVNISGVIFVNQSILDDNTATFGAAINSSGTFTITDGELVGNVASQTGGGIFSSGKGTVSGTKVADNSALIGGGIFSAKNSILTINSSANNNALFQANTASNGGGIDSLGSLIVSNATFSGNMATGSGANDGGAILNDLGTATITGSTFSQNSAANGGGIDSINGKLTITGGSFTNNTATGFGGGVASSGTTTVSGVTFQSNSASTGVGGAIYDQGTLTVQSGTFSFNSARNGGAILNQGNLSLVDSTFSQNSAGFTVGFSGSGGAIYNSSGSVAISGGSLTSNNASAGGGGIFVNQGVLSIVAGTAITGNSAANGGGLDVAQGSLSLTNVSVSSNTATGQGGGIFTSPASLGTVVNIATFAGNVAAVGGALDNQGPATILDVTFSGNGDSSTSDGGAIANSGTLKLTNSTIAGNTAANGGGVFNSLGNLTTINVTIAANSASGPDAGGGLDITGGSVLLFNTIVATNQPSDISGSVNPASSFNLIGSGGSGGLTDGVNDNLVGEAPDLGPLADNGGPTETIALDAGSAAIDAGGNSIVGVSVPTSDERGALRGGTSGQTGLNAGLRVDIGAFEASSSYLVTTTVDSLAYGTLRSAVGWANKSLNFNPANIANPAPNTVVFDTPNLFSSPQTITLTQAQGTLDFTNTATAEAIQGDGVGKLTISGGNAVGVFSISSDVTVSLGQFTLSKGLSATGAGITNAGVLTLNGMTVSANTATGSGGGAIWNENGATLTINNSSLANNAASFESGGAILSDGSLTINNSVLTGNSAFSGGAVFSDGALLMLSGSTLTGNTASTGGAITNNGITSFSIAGSTISGNSASSGGGIYNNGTDPLTIVASTFSNNTAGFAGGAIYNTVEGTVTVLGSTFSGNTASAEGGAVYNDNIFNSTGSTFSNNSASPNGTGGGISSFATLNLTNTTVAFNTAGFGGGIQSVGTLTAINDTIAYNTAASGGVGGGLVVNGTTDLYNTIVALNTLGGTIPNDINGTVDPASANNLIGDASTSGGLVNGTNGNLVGLAPGLASGLANNGGPTQTIALVSGSAAIDAGANVITGITVPTVDQRGAQRGPAGLNAGSKVDIGAYEASSSYLVSTTTDSTGVGTLRAAISWANVSTNANPAQTLTPQPNTIVFGVSGPFTLSQGPLKLTNTTLGEVIDAPGQTISGGGISGVITVASGVTATITGSASQPLTITGGNTATNGGGIDNSGTLTLTNVILQGNTGANGGGLANEAGASFTLTDSSVYGNTATTSGGGIANMGTATLLHDLIGTLGGNVAGSRRRYRQPVERSIDHFRRQGHAGAAILTVSETTFASNSAARGGAIDNTGVFTLGDSTLTANSASLAGGGIDDEAGGTLTATNVTIANNSAVTGGGMITNGSVVLIDATVAYNQSGPTGTGGGLAVAAGGVDTLYNTIVANNKKGTTASDIALSGGGIISPVSSFNLIGTGGAGNLINGFDNNKILTGSASAGLASGLANNGGPTQTIALVATSPAIDAGGAAIPGAFLPVTDQRGALRGPAGLDAGTAPDVGALEETSSYLVTTASGRPDIGTIETAAGWANLNVNTNPANPTHSAPNTIVFDSTGVFAIADTITLSAPLVLNNQVTPEAIDGSNTTGITISGGGAVGVLSIASGATVTISGLTIANGSATNGGGIDNFGTLVVNDATISQNTAISGGAIDNEAGAKLTIQSSTLSSNSATTGGAIDNAGVATLTNTTIAGDSANTGGGIDNSGTLTLINATIAYNTAGTGGGLNLNSGSATLYNTIVALNTNGTSAADDISTATGVTVAANSSFNLTGTGGSGGLSSAPAQGNLLNVSSANLHLGPLASNGGPTQTIALLAGSPAINTGAGQIAGVSVPLNDQRGAARSNVSGGAKIDIGAFEISSSYLVTTTGDSLSSGTLRSALVWANTTPSSASSGPNTVFFDPTLFNTTTPQTITLSPTFGTLALSDTAKNGMLIDGPGAGALTISGNGLLGVFSVDSGVTAAFSDLTIADGLASSTTAPSGGAIMNLGNLTITGVSFTGNGAVNYGGAIDNQGGTLTVSNSTFTNNVATYGGGGAIENTGTLTVTGSTFTGGVAFDGGGIDNLSGTLAVVNSTFENNTGTVGGDIFNNGTATIASSTIANGNAFDGGGIANNLLGVLTLVNSTVAFNNAGKTGGGIETVGTLTVINSTIAYNTIAPGGSGGGIDASQGNANVFNTIIVSNTSGTGKTANSSDVSGAFGESSAFNLIGTGGSGGLTEGIDGNQVAVTSPGLATALANNGGPTQTLALLAGSPAIDAGSNALAVDANGNPLLYDQRGIGYPRIVNLVVDIGSFERSLATTTVVKSSLNPAQVGDLIVFTATVSPSNANVITPTGTVTFYNGTTVMGMVTLVNGAATLSTSTLPFGVSSISAVYSGNLTFADSTSTPLSETVNLLIATPLAITAAPTAVALADPSVAYTSTITVAAEHHGKVAKKAASTKKVHPTGGSSTKFHQTKHSASLKRAVAAITQHATVKVKKK